MFRPVTKRVFFFACTLALCLTANAQEPFHSSVESKVNILLDDYSIPGAAVAVIEDGEIVSINGYGFAEIGNGLQVTTDTKFRIGSLSKIFTAWAAMKLVETGHLDLDRPVSEYLRRWKIPPSLFAESSVTMRRLLSHTAGISTEFFDEYMPGELVPELPDLLNGQDRPYQKVTIAKRPGLQWMYSDGGFAIAELVIEEITGSTFEDYVTANIIKPLGLSNTGYAPTGQVASPYSSIQSELDRTRVASSAASGLFSTIRDLAKFAAASLGATTVPANKTDVLTQESIIGMQVAAADTRGGYGLGYSTRSTPAGDAVVGHGAALEGWHSNIALMPARGKGIIILTNSTSGGNLTTRLRCDWYHDIIGAIPAGACRTDLGAKIVKPLLATDVDAAIDMFRTNVSRVEDFYIDEWQLNGLGYDLIADNRIDDAIKIFEVNVEFYANESNPHDSLAEAYLIKGDRAKAVMHFKRALEIDPSNENARSNLVRLGEM